MGAEISGGAKEPSDEITLATLRSAGDISSANRSSSAAGISSARRRARALELDRSGPGETHQPHPLGSDLVLSSLLGALGVLRLGAYEAVPARVRGRAPARAAPSRRPRPEAPPGPAPRFPRGSRREHLTALVGGHLAEGRQRSWISVTPRRVPRRAASQSCALQSPRSSALSPRSCSSSSSVLAGSLSGAELTEHGELIGAVLAAAGLHESRPFHVSEPLTQPPRAPGRIRRAISCCPALPDCSESSIASGRSLAATAEASISSSSDRSQGRASVATWRGSEPPPASRDADVSLDHGDHERGSVLAVVSHRAAAFPGVELEPPVDLGEIRNRDVGRGADHRAFQGQIARIPVDGGDPLGARIAAPAFKRPRSDPLPDLRQVDPTQLFDGTGHRRPQ